LGGLVAGGAPRADVVGDRAVFGFEGVAGLNEIGGFAGFKSQGGVFFRGDDFLGGS
jgi:hypothetical protein